MQSFEELIQKDLSGKKVVVRLALDSPISGGIFQNTLIFLQHQETILNLCEKGASVILLSHQGIAGHRNFTSLKPHAVQLSKNLRKKVKFVDDFLGSKASKAINSLGKGKILLLENLNFLSEENLFENQVDTLMVKALSSCDFFVNDDLTSCSYAKTSSVGLPKVLPPYSGLSLEKELNAVRKLSEKNEEKKIFLLGGANPAESIQISIKALENNSLILSAGVFGELVLLAKGNDVGEKTHWLKQNYSAELAKLSSIIKTHGERFFAPVDLAFEDSEGFRVEALVEEVARSKFLPFDVGTKTAKAYSEALNDARIVFFKGTLGSVEKTAFQLGTQALLKSLHSGNSYSIIAGDELVKSIGRFNLSYKKFGLVSNHSTAFTKAFCNERLPGLTALGGLT